MDMNLWTPMQTRLIKRAASYPEVSRILAALVRISLSVEDMGLLFLEETEGG